MSDTDNSQKTEEPTQRRLEKAREEGQVPRSREINSWVILASAILIIASAGPYFASVLSKELSPFIISLDKINASPTELIERVRKVGIVIVLVVLMPCLLIALLSVAANIAQFGVLFTTKTFVPKLDKFSLIKGLKRIFSRDNLFEFTKGFIKIIIVGVVGVLTVIPEIQSIDTLPRMAINEVDDFVVYLLVKVIGVMLAVYLSIAVADLFYQFFAHRRKLRMSHQEIKDEHKQTEGDPHIKARVRQIRMERHRQRLTESMGRADVVVTNPTHISVALEYKPKTMDAPVLVAKGESYRAIQIKKLAEKAEIPIIEDPPVARLLYATCKENQEIATEHYEAVAVIISKLMKLKNRMLS